MKVQNADIVIIGAGAAGLMAAAGAGITSPDKKIVVLEKMPRPARKIMITGKGRCNFTNAKPWNEFSRHIHPKANFLKPSFYNLTSEGMIDFLEKHGLATVVERGDRAYPESRLASDVIDTLVRAAQRAGAEIICNKEVDDISKEGERFSVRCADSEVYTCQKLIICTGGLSYPRTGSTGDGYRWAEDFGHKIRPCFPSLTAMVPRGYKLDESFDEMKGHINRANSLSELGSSLCGIQLKNVGLTLIADGNELAQEFGDIDFTDGGIEGPIGFKLSRKCVNAIVNGSKANLSLDLKPAVEIEDLDMRIKQIWQEIANDKRSANKQYKDRFRILLGKLMPMNLIPAFVKTFPNTDHKTLAKVLKNWKMEVAGFVGYERCVITAGGVSQDEVTPKTLESKLTPGLYFAGELLDIDADTGGYNLQCAFSTGYLAGINAAKSCV
jgi:predicted Rossmann fold flavoprotein